MSCLVHKHIGSHTVHVSVQGRVFVGSTPPLLAATVQPRLVDPEGCLAPVLQEDITDEH